MNIDGMIWLEKIVDKLEKKHHITPNEVEQVFMDNPQYRFLEKGKIEGENVYSAYGRTDAGRYVTVIFILKFRKCALIISARDMDKKERKQYGK
ncbi:MAG: BrnT family toxin [bacterium]|nr:BrnT family toxin [bacterium]